MIAANLVNAACGAVCLALVVQRAKKCDAAARAFRSLSPLHSALTTSLALSLYIYESVSLCSVRCLDFAATTYLLHLLLCAAYAGWPVAFEWWALNAGCLVLMAVLGEYVCMRRELREIPLTSGAGLGGLSMGSRAQAGGARGLLAISAIGSRVGGLLSGGLALSQAGGVVHGSSP